MPLGAAGYAALIVSIERATRMFWALAQREKDRKRWREEALDEGRETGIELGLQQGLREGLQQGLQEGRQQGLQEGREDERARIERELADNGVELPPEILEIIRDPHSGNGRITESP